jgi:hypothetical protein
MVESDVELIKQALSLASDAMRMAEKSTEESHETTKSVLVNYATVTVVMVICIFLFSVYSTYMTYSYDYQYSNVNYNENRNVNGGQSNE